MAFCYFMKYSTRKSLLGTSRSISTRLDNRTARIKRLKEKEEKGKVDFAHKKVEPLHRSAIYFRESSLADEECTNPLQKGKLPNVYDPHFVEKGWYDWWKTNHVFEPCKDNENTFSMAIPPPNVTGNLHLGHALTITLEDILCRWNRMNKKKVLWIPGCDHAGIATQAIVEKHLAQTHSGNQDIMHKEKFINEIWKWKNEKQNNIYGQIERMGASLNWNHSIFTLDPTYTKAVTAAFVKLYQKRLIYRDSELVNWCCHLKTTISNIEVDYTTVKGPVDICVPGYEEPITFGLMYNFAYKLAEPVDDITEIVVATTRLETVFGDVAIAVHPDDKRYSKLVGKFVQNPLVSGALLPVIASTSVNPDLGTGAVKITPGHDFRDFEVGKQNNLKTKIIFDDSGCLQNTGNQDFDNISRFHGRVKAIKELKKLGLYRGSHPHGTQIPRCSRSGDIIEPMIKSQWFVDLKKLSESVTDIVDSEKLKILPESYTKEWNAWLKRADNWCISRQLWWGHKIPAYYVDGTENKWIVADNREDALKQAKALYGNTFADKDLIQDEDVLDTWFSSALYPFAILGWPDSLNNEYYPLDVMETGYDLLFFWVAKMTMLGFALTEQVPFRTVFLHPLIRDAHGRKMSKSLGNVIDPLHVVDGIDQQTMLENIDNSILTEQEKSTSKREVKKMFANGIPACGTDALRFSLAISKSTSDIDFNINNVLTYRKFCNKIWNAYKFLIFHLKNNKGATNPGSLRPIDKWMKSRLSSVQMQYQEHLKTFKFSNAALLVYNFWLKEICDVYIESCKKVLNNNPNNCDGILRNVEYVIDGGLRLLSPFMPYITEELWQRLPNNNGKFLSIAVAPFLYSENDIDEDLELKISQVLHIVHCIRSNKQTFEISKDSIITINVNSQENFLEPFVDVIKHLCNMDNIYTSTNTCPNCDLLSYNEVILLEGNHEKVTLCFYIEKNDKLLEKTNLMKKRIEKLLKKQKKENENEQMEINSKIIKYQKFVKLLETLK